MLTGEWRKNNGYACCCHKSGDSSVKAKMNGLPHLTSNFTVMETLLSTGLLLKWELLCIFNSSLRAMCNLTTLVKANVMQRRLTYIKFLKCVRKYAENLFTSTLERSRCLTQTFDRALGYQLFMSYGRQIFLFIWLNSGGFIKGIL